MQRLFQRWSPKRPLQAPVAQLDRALPSEGRGHRFESCRVHHFLPVKSDIWHLPPLAGSGPCPQYVRGTLDVLRLPPVAPSPRTGSDRVQKSCPAAPEKHAASQTELPHTEAASWAAFFLMAGAREIVRVITSGSCWVRPEKYISGAEISVFWISTRHLRFLTVRSTLTRQVRFSPTCGWLHGQPAGAGTRRGWMRKSRSAGRLAARASLPRQKTDHAVASAIRSRSRVEARRAEAGSSSVV